MSWWYPLFTRTTPFPGNFPSWLPREQVTSHFWFFVKRQKVKYTTRPKSNSIKLVYFWRQVENRHPFPSPPAQLLIAKLYLHLYFKNTDIRHFLTCWISKSIHLHLCTTPSVLHITAGHPPMAARVWGSSPAVLEFGSLARSGVAASCLCVCDSWVPWKDGARLSVTLSSLNASMHAQIEFLSLGTVWWVATVGARSTPFRGLRTKKETWLLLGFDFP